MIKRCKAASFKEVQVYHNEIICKKKSVGSATTRISGYCKAAFFIFTLQSPGHDCIKINSQIYVTASKILISIWQDNLQRAVFPLCKCLMFLKTTKIQNWFNDHLLGNATHSWLRQMAWKIQEERIFSFFEGAVPGSLSTRIMSQVLLLSRRRWHRPGAAGRVKQSEKFFSGKENILLLTKLLKLKNYVTC